MADLTDLQAAETIKIVGSDLTGVETNAVNSTANGALHVNLNDSAGIELLGQKTMAGSIPVVLSSVDAQLNMGDILLSVANVQAAVRRTVYTEQITNAQRSIVSSSASDAGAGTGAQQVTLTYLTSTGTGPFTEVITLNGTTPVNTVSSTICFIEKIVITRVGSTGSNVGTISLKAATGGGGVTVGTIAPTDLRTFWSHHYVPVGKTCYINTIRVSSSSTTNAQTAIFIVKEFKIGVTGSPNIQISDFHRCYGQSSTDNQPYKGLSSIGPSRLITFTTPDSGSSIIYRAALEFYEV